MAALDVGDAAARAAYLDSACGGDAELRERIERLLKLEAESRDFLEPATVPLPRKGFPPPGQAVGYFGDYVLLDEIAHGSSGVVFRARQSSLGRIVALKMLRDRPLLTSEADTRRFRAEAEAVASLDHPHIVPIYEVGAHEGQAYFSMKLVVGGTLQSRMAEFHADPRKAVALLVTAARAVQHAHDHGILHRDLKPGNILLDSAGEPYITDFGLAKRVGLESSLTMSGHIMGTPHYMAPEQARGENRDLGPGADVYSLGAILFELLAGRRPFLGDDLVALLPQVADASPPLLRSLVPTLDRDLETVVMRCLEKAPADRYPSAGELADDLERWLRGEPVRARPVGPVSRLIKWARRRPAQAGLAAALILIAGLAAFTVFHAPSPASTGSVASTATEQGPPPPPAYQFDPPLSDEEAAANRRAAEWFLAVKDDGEKVFPMNNVDIRTERGQLIKIKRVQDFPAGKWVIEEIDFDDWIQTAVIAPTMEDDFIRATQPLTRLKEFGSRRIACHSRCFAFLARNPGLEIVSITRAPFDDAVLEHLKDLKKLRRLTLIDGKAFTGKGFDRLVCLSVLEKLDLSFTPTSDAMVGELPACASLTSLNLSNTQVTDASAPSLRRHPRLRVLYLDQTKFTDASLAELGAIPMLDQLHLRCPGVTAEARARFREAHPRCKVVP